MNDEPKGGDCMKKVWGGMGILIGLALFGAGAISAEGPSPKPAAVAIKVFQFQPNRLEVKTGASVTWTNGDDIEHTVTSGTPERPDGRFNSVLPGKGTTARVTFTEAGNYPYFCHRHQSMRGEIRVN
jgi:plastocyanin